MTPATQSCIGCGTPRPEHAHRHNWARRCCRNCYDRWRYHGFEGDRPPAPIRPAATGSRAVHIEDYTDLRSFGLSVAEAAERMGVKYRTALEVYEPARRRQAA